MTKRFITVLLLLTAVMMLFAEGKPLQRQALEAVAAGDDAYTAKNYTQAYTKYAEAIEKYRQAEKEESIDLGNMITDVQDKLFKAYYFGEKYNEAIAVYADMLKKDASDIKKVRVIAQIYEKNLKQPAKAIEHLKAWDAKGANFTLRKEIASLYDDMGNKQEALNWYVKAKEVKQDAKVIQKIAVLYRELGDVPMAIKEYEDYLKTNPSASSKLQTYKNMGALYEMIKQPDNAVKAFENALKVKYDSQIATKLMVMYFDMNNFAQATAKVKRILQDDPADPDATYYQAQIKYKEGNKQGALEDFKKIQNDRKYGESAKGFIKSIESEL